MFLIADFVNENVTDVVPSKWLIDSSHCYWPPKKFKSYEVANFIRRQVEPEIESWRTCSIDILSKADTFDGARRKLTKACKSDLEQGRLTSDPENYGRGKRRRRPAVTSYTSSSSEDEDETNEKVQRILEAFPQPPPSSITSASYHQLSASQSIPTAGQINSFTSKLSENISSITEKQKENPSGSFNTIKSSTPKKQKKKDTLELILRNQKHMEMELRSLREAVDRLTDRHLNIASISNANAENTQELCSFPLKGDEDLTELENLLSHEENQKHFVKKFRSFGGSDFPDHTRRVMRYVFTDDFAEKYNWLGNREKKKFSSLMICRLIIDAVCEENNATRAGVEKVMKNWLRHAKERKNYIRKNVENVNLNTE